MAEVSNSSETQNNLPKDNENKKSNRIFIIIIIILSVLCAVLLWKYFELRKLSADKSTEIEYIADDREKIQNELENMLAEYDSLEVDNDSMRVELSQRKEEIQELLEKVKNKDWTIYKLRKETNTLRTIMKSYVYTIDSLNTLNIVLTEENQEVKSTLNKERGRVRELRQTNKGLSGKVEIASRLKINSVNAFGVRVKRDMTGTNTRRSNRADKIRVCFNVEENLVAEPGDKTFYIRVIAPDGKILTDDDVEPYFEYDGLEGVYSDKYIVNYQNKPVSDVCLDWAKPNDNHEFASGIYEIFIYAENYRIGQASVELK